MEYQHFPTQFARSLMIEVGLYHKDIFSMTSQDERFEEADLWYGAIRNFQKLALFNNYDDSLVAYHGIELSDVQSDALTIIHASSKTWALGHVAEQLLIKLEDDPKQLGELARTLIEQLSSTESVTTQNVKRYVVQLAEEV